jgi:hypothetical protein
MSTRRPTKEHELTALIAKVDQLAARDLWPGYDPRQIPLAIYAGDHTLLFRHPNPPSEFGPLPGQADVSGFDGLHPAVRANSSAELEGVVTATMLLDNPDGKSVVDSAGLVIHEMFHVFQRTRHPDWTANEVELFVYPVEDVELLALWRLETEALRRAIAATETVAVASWAQAALEARRTRFRKLSNGSIAYERGLELVEGTAQYVEWRAMHPADLPTLPEDGFAADQVRTSRYTVGHVIGKLLDRLAPDWRQNLEVGKAQYLDELLEHALDRIGVKAVTFTEDERMRALMRARADVDALQAKRSALRDEFLGRPGWRIEVRARMEELLWPAGFDPNNAYRLGSGEVLHTRYIGLKGRNNQLEVLGRGALTEAAGTHPLFDGVCKVSVTGLETMPAVRQEGNTTLVTAEGFSGVFHNARIEHRGWTLTLHL